MWQKRNANFLIYSNLGPNFLFCIPKSQILAMTGTTPTDFNLLCSINFQVAIFDRFSLPCCYCWVHGWSSNNHCTTATQGLSWNKKVHQKEWHHICHEVGVELSWAWGMLYIGLIGRCLLKLWFFLARLKSVNWINMTKLT